VFKRACNEGGISIAIITAYYVCTSLIFLTDHYVRLLETKDREYERMMSVGNEKQM
jgi:hypothetical protein